MSDDGYRFRSMGNAAVDDILLLLYFLLRIYRYKPPFLHKSKLGCGAHPCPWAGSLEVFKVIKDLRSRVDVRRRTLSAVDAHLPLSAVLEGDCHCLPIADSPLNE